MDGSFARLATDSLDPQTIVARGGTAYLAHIPQQQTIFHGAVPLVQNDPQRFSAHQLVWDGQSWQPFGSGGDPTSASLKFLYSASGLTNLRQRARELLGSVGLQDRMGHFPARLSGGEQQRVAIARALINRPKVVLADEPTGNLDPQTGAEILDVLRKQQSVENQTFILVTHDPQIAATADRHIQLEQLSHTSS